MNSYHAVANAQQEIRRSFESFQAIVELSERFLRGGKYDTAAVCAQIATDSAIWHHPGLLFSPRLERVLSAIGNDATQEVSRRGHSTAHSGGPGDVLHVLTKALPIGGHTRFVWRWIQNDSERRHSVVLTSQGAAEIPKQLVDAVSSTGGILHSLDREPLDPVAKARALRSISALSDIVVLQLNVEDIVPCIAFSKKPGLPPIVYVTQNDVNFWVGVNMSDLVVCLRDSTQRLGVKRRAIQAERTAPIPIPLKPPERSLSVAQAKERLGLSAETVVLLSIARPAKYKARFRPTFLDAIAPVIEEDERTTLLVVGPNPKDEWAAAQDRTHGRIVALGLLTDTAPYYEAADIYLDSIPLASNTSLLEAGCYGLPLVSYFPYSSESEVLGADSPGLDGIMLRPVDIEGYREAVRNLIRDGAYRSRTGTRTREQILHFHSGNGWKRFIDELYVKVGTIPTINRAILGEDMMSLGELDVLLSEIFSIGDDARWVNDNHIKTLPYSRRLALCLDLWRISRRFSLSTLLPEGLAQQVRRTRTSGSPNAS